MVAYQLVGLVPFATQDDGVARSRAPDREVDGTCAIEKDEVPARCRREVRRSKLHASARDKTCNDGSRDLESGLPSRVVVRHNHYVGAGSSGFPHQTALRSIAIAAAPEDGKHPPARESTNGRQDTYEGVGCVGVVDEHDHVVVTRLAAFEPPRRADFVAKCAGRARYVEIEGDDDAERYEEVLQVVRAE